MPAGMEPSDKSMLVPVDEPSVFRSVVDRQGAHAIAGGFRQKTHVLFDALRVRMAATWPGDFLRTDGAWNGRGGNYTGMLSNTVLQLPPGPSLAAQYSIDGMTQRTRTPANPDATIRAFNDPKTPARELVTPLKWTPRANGG